MRLLIHYQQILFTFQKQSGHAHAGRQGHDAFQCESVGVLDLLIDVSVLRSISAAGLPVSTTQVITGALLAVGLFEGHKGVNIKGFIRVSHPCTQSRTGFLSLQGWARWYLHERFGVFELATSTIARSFCCMCKRDSRGQCNREGLPDWHVSCRIIVRGT